MEGTQADWQHWRMCRPVGRGSRRCSTVNFWRTPCAQSRQSALDLCAEHPQVSEGGAAPLSRCHSV